MRHDPTPSVTPALPETVVIEVTRQPDAQEVVNIEAHHIQHTGLVWERIVHLCQLGLRAATVQTVTQAPEPSRLVAPGGFVLPPSAGH